MYKPSETNFNSDKNESLWEQLTLIPTKWHRLSHSLDMKLATNILVEEFKQLNSTMPITTNENKNVLQRIYERFERVLNAKNDSARQQINLFLNEAVENVLSNVRYHFFAHDGPQWRRASKETPLARCYFYFEAPEISDKLSKQQM